MMAHQPRSSTSTETDYRDGAFARRGRNGDDRVAFLVSHALSSRSGLNNDPPPLPTPLARGSHSHFFTERQVDDASFSGRHGL